MTTGSKLGQAERLGHVIVGARVERDDLVGFGVARGQDEDRRGRVAADSADQDESIRVEAAQIEQDDVRSGRSPVFESGPDVTRLRDAVAVCLEVRCDRPSGRLVVLHQKDVGAAGGHRGSVSLGAGTRPGRDRARAR